jgi:hypothetical protein
VLSKPHVLRFKEAERFTLMPMERPLEQGVGAHTGGAVHAGGPKHELGGITTAGASRASRFSTTGRKLLFENMSNPQDGMRRTAINELNGTTRQSAAATIRLKGINVSMQMNKQDQCHCSRAER